MGKIRVYLQLFACVLISPVHDNHRKWPAAIFGIVKGRAAAFAARHSRFTD